VSHAWVAVVAPFALTIAFIAILLRTRWTSHLADHPNERSLHTQPTPRVGGIAMMLAAIPVAMFFSAGVLDRVWTLALALALVSFADDVRSLPVSVRIAVHFAVAAIAAASILPAEGEWPVILLAMLAIGWLTNLYNFMDGSDGLAGGMTAMGFGACAIAAAQSGHAPLALGSASLAAAALAFLLFNFPPARVFMGDAGSIPLGFLVGALGLQGAITGAWSVVFPLVVFSPFVFDASLTIARRALRRERIWAAHRSHLYQRLVLSGWSSRRLAWIAYAVMAAASASALATRAQGLAMQCAILVVWGFLFVAAMMAIDRKGDPASASR
jgi:UDP-N-acetylmuramyl pentapeptide phosphotransferase/UDP-N-acetylglucosamine-1-phosphate transferase